MSEKTAQKGTGVEEFRAIKRIVRLQALLSQISGLPKVKATKDGVRDKIRKLLRRQ